MHRGIGRSCTKKAGLTLLEVLIASVVFSVGVLGLLSAITSATIVDSVAYENNLALEAAREVIERVKSEGAAALSGRIHSEAAQYSAAGASTGQDQATAGQPPAAVDQSAPVQNTTAVAAAVASQGNGQGNGPSGGQAQNQGGGNGQGSGNSTSATAPSAKDTYGTFGSPTAVSGAADSAAPNDSGTPLGLSWFGAPLGLENGIIEVDTLGNFAVRGLEPRGDDPDGKVGKVVVTQYAQDVVEITVTVRWFGSRGRGEQVLRCRITDWQGQDGR